MQFYIFHLLVDLLATCVQYTTHIEQSNAHSSGIWSARWSPRSNVVITGSLDKTIKVWDAETGEYYRTLHGHNLGIISLDIDPMGEMIVSVSLDNTIRRWSVTDGIHLETIQVKPGDAWSCQFSPSSEVRYFATSSQKGKVDLWDISTMPSSSPNGKLLAFSAENDCIHLFDVESGKNIHKFKGETGCPIRTIDFTPNSSLLISGSDDETINIYDVRHFNRIGKCTGLDGFVMSVAAAGDNEHFVSGSTDGKVKLWNIENKQCLSTVGQHTEQVSALSWNPDGDKFISVSEDRSLKWYTAAS
ncbi:839_t:CDS:10 [Dentiscutata erythropus]|uniref:839_t:CDS:1 n=1 Tax=Dentiscutata erythropus TaxID=1348616 RepID=A0A9N8VGY0_9GLOM|nr:839_t:CDS:10 [Dentiscutata erythropus]